MQVFMHIILFIYVSLVQLTTKLSFKASRPKWLNKFEC